MPEETTAINGPTAAPVTKPRLRGISHLVAFATTLLAGGALIATAPPGAVLVSAVYVLGILALFGVSALYHVPTWSPRRRKLLRRCDHSAIFLAIAGTYTPIAALAVGAPLGTVVLSIVWLGAAAGIFVKFRWIDAPKWAQALPYVALGWVAVAVIPELLASMGGGGVTLLLAGGVLYTVGALVYARRWPDPAPRTFGYHEVFHALVIAAVACHFAVVAIYAVPLA